MPDAAEDDEALRWDGDEDETTLARPTPTLTATRAVAGAAAPREQGRGTAVGLVAFGVLLGIALLETVGWVRSGFGLVLGASLTTGAGTPLEIASYGINVLFRIAAVLSPLVWAAMVVWRVPSGLLRLAWLALGALVLVPWPVIVQS